MISLSNMDNVYLRTEQKGTKNNLELLEARYKLRSGADRSRALERRCPQEWGPDGPDSRDDRADVFETIATVGEAVSPILLPMIDSLGDLDLDG